MRNIQMALDSLSVQYNNKMNNTAAEVVAAVATIVNCSTVNRINSKWIIHIELHMHMAHYSYFIRPYCKSIHDFALRSRSDKLILVLCLPHTQFTSENMQILGKMSPFDCAFYCLHVDGGRE